MDMLVWRGTSYRPREMYRFLPHDLKKGISKDYTPVSFFSLHTPEKDGVWWSNTWVSLILEGAGGLGVPIFEERPPGSEETACFCGEDRLIKEKEISADEGHISTWITEVLWPGSELIVLKHIFLLLLITFAYVFYVCIISPAKKQVYPMKQKE